MNKLLSIFWKKFFRKFLKRFLAELPRGVSGEIPDRVHDEIAGGNPEGVMGLQE